MGACSGGGECGETANSYKSVKKKSIPIQTELIWPVWLSYVTCLSHLFTTFNCSVNFYIYSYKHRKRGRERVRHFSTWSTDIVNLVNISKTQLRKVPFLTPIAMNTGWEQFQDVMPVICAVATLTKFILLGIVASISVEQYFGLGLCHSYILVLIKKKI